MTGRKSTTRKPAARRRPAKPATISLEIPRELHGELLELAEREERTLAGLVRYALRVYVDRARDPERVAEALTGKASS